MGLSILGVISLLVLIVWALHRHQQRKNEESVDRNLPLPPLEFRENNVEGMDVAEDILGITPDARSAPTPPPLREQQNTVASYEGTEQWLHSSRELLSQGKFEEALNVCQGALPQMGAFRQACVILRAQIRDLKKQGRSYLQPLTDLYHMAALADFFHAKGANIKSLSPIFIKQIDFTQWQSLATPYARLGYKRIALLTKTDVKWFVQEWGEPDAHEAMHELHQQQWQTMSNSLL